MLKDGVENWRLNRVLSSDTSKVGIDKICFNIDDLKNELKRSLGERFSLGEVT